MQQASAEMVLSRQVTLGYNGGRIHASAGLHATRPHRETAHALQGDTRLVVRGNCETRSMDRWHGAHHTARSEAGCDRAERRVDTSGRSSQRPDPPLARLHGLLARVQGVLQAAPVHLAPQPLLVAVTVLLRQ